MTISYDKIAIDGKTLFGRRIDDAAVRECPQVLAEAYFLYIRKGACTVYSNDSTSHLLQGESVIMSGGMYVGHIFPDEEDHLFEALSVRFHQDLLKTLFQSEWPNLSPHSDSPNGLFMHKLDHSALIHHYIQGVNHYFDHRQLITPDILRLKVKEIILLLLQTDHADKIKNILLSPLMKRTLTFMQIIDAHLYSDLSLKELAHLTNMSLSSFKRHFTKEFNTTPRLYFQNKRLERARHLLENSDQSISGIAHSCGFKTVSHFSKKFREKYRVSPSDVRLSLTEQ